MTGFYGVTFKSFCSRRATSPRPRWGTFYAIKLCHFLAQISLNSKLHRSQTTGYDKLLLTKVKQMFNSFEHVKSYRFSSGAPELLNFDLKIGFLMPNSILWQLKMFRFWNVWGFLNCFCCYARNWILVTLILVNFFGFLVITRYHEICEGCQ